MNECVKTFKEKDEDKDKKKNLSVGIDDDKLLEKYKSI